MTDIEMYKIIFEKISREVTTGMAQLDFNPKPADLALILSNVCSIAEQGQKLVETGHMFAQKEKDFIDNY